jgi:hypothetical protein
MPQCEQAGASLEAIGHGGRIACLSPGWQARVFYADEVAGQ